MHTELEELSCDVPQLTSSTQLCSRTKSMSHTKNKQVRKTPKSK
jgi:hypothetical protein